MKTKFFFLFVLTSFLLCNCSQKKESVVDYRLWYDEPAEEWVEALPVGNGRLGAMVFGGVEKERLQLN